MAIMGLKKTYILLIGVIFLTACLKELDYSGAIRSTDRVNERFSQSVQWNKLNNTRVINLDTDNYNLLLAADIHIGGTINFKKLLSNAKMPGISALIIDGDITTGNKADYDILEQLIKEADSVRSFLVAGNHDLYYDGWPIFYSFFGSSTYTITVKTPSDSDLYICLDTGSGTLGDKQLDWLRDLLQNHRKSYRNCVVVTHNNFFRNTIEISTNPLIEELYVLLDLFAKNQVNLVITGHEHQRFDEVFGPTTYITLDALKDGLNNASYLKLSVVDGKLAYKFINI